MAPWGFHAAAHRTNSGILPRVLQPKHPGLRPNSPMPTPVLHEHCKAIDMYTNATHL